MANPIPNSAGGVAPPYSSRIIVPDDSMNPIFVLSESTIDHIIRTEAQLRDHATVTHSSQLVVSIWAYNGPDGVGWRRTTIKDNVGIRKLVEAARLLQEVMQRAPNKISEVLHRPTAVAVSISAIEVIDITDSPSSDTGSKAASSDTAHRPHSIEKRLDPATNSMDSATIPDKMPIQDGRATGATSSSDSVVCETAENRSNNGLETIPNSPVSVSAMEFEEGTVLTTGPRLQSRSTPNISVPQKRKCSGAGERTAQSVPLKRSARLRPEEDG
ncbi:hypothetical protein BJX63DRAFT_416156 [Aspergillus granulosus]|uniref:Uncharacterized protein n=1 Tax=Aspergillus granulosus TaxID=176169 RepID=A0ABR4GS90_9EURO